MEIFYLLPFLLLALYGGVRLSNEKKRLEIKLETTKAISQFELRLRDSVLTKDQAQQIKQTKKDLFESRVSELLNKGFSEESAYRHASREAYEALSSK